MIGDDPTLTPPWTQGRPLDGYVTALGVRCDRVAETHWCGHTAVMSLHLEQRESRWSITAMISRRSSHAVGSLVLCSHGATLADAERELELVWSDVMCAAADAGARVSGYRMPEAE